jgi:WD40 repeat protein
VDHPFPLWVDSHAGRDLILAPGDRLFSVNSGKVVGWEMATGRPAPWPAEVPRGLDGIAASPDGHLLAMSGRIRTGPQGQGPVTVVDRETGRKILEPGGIRGLPSPLAFSRDGKRLGAFHTEPRGFLAATVWDLATGEKAGAWNSGIRSSPARAFSPDLDRLAVAVKDAVLSVVEIATGKEVLRIEDRSSGYLHPHFSPDGKRLACLPSHSNPRDGRVRIWDIDTGKEILSFPGMHPAAFHPSGKLLACSGVNNAIELWDLSSGLKKASFRAHAEPIRTLVFSADGTHLASNDQGGIVKVWDVSRWVEPGPAQ